MLIETMTNNTIWLVATKLLSLARFKSNKNFTSYLVRKLLLRKLFQGKKTLQLNFLV